MRLLAAPFFVLFAFSACADRALPQQASPALNQLCAIEFDADGAISSDSTACLDLLATTLRVSTRQQLLLTGTPANTAAVEDYLVGRESIPASAIRVANAAGNDANTVQSALVRPLPVPLAEVRPPMEADELAMPAPPPARPVVGASPGPSLIKPNPYSLGDAAAAWRASLQSGAIEYNVPPVMIAQQGSTVTVIVHGYKDPNPHVLKAGAGVASAAVKVSDMMEVDLIGSPTEFTIVPQATPATQFVPIDGYATWIWSVTPVNEATAQQLTVKVSLIPDASSGLPAQLLAAPPYTVDVKVESLWSVLADRWHKDPMTAIAYLLPGGAGWAALGTLLTTLGVGTWLRNKLGKAQAGAAATNQKPTAAV